MVRKFPSVLVLPLLVLALLVGLGIFGVRTTANDHVKSSRVGRGGGPRVGAAGAGLPGRCAGTPNTHLHPCASCLLLHRTGESGHPPNCPAGPFASVTTQPLSPSLSPSARAPLYLRARARNLPSRLASYSCSSSHHQVDAEAAALKAANAYSLSLDAAILPVLTLGTFIRETPAMAALGPAFPRIAADLLKQVGRGVGGGGMGEGK